MATTYNTAFGSLPGYNELLGTTNTTGGGQQQTYGQTTQTTTTRPPYQAGQTFAQMQQRGMARPAPPSAPQAQAFQQYGGSQQAQQMRQRLQSQLETFGQTPSRFDTQAFQQIRGAQQANLQSEFQEQQRQLNEDLARRGLSASNIAASGLGRLGGAQARALADIDAQLLQRAAETQAQDRAQLLSEGRGLAELASSQDLAQFEANRVAQAATFENQLRAAQFGQQQFEQAGQEAFQGAQAEEAAQQAARAFDLQATGQAAGLSMDLQRLLGQQEVERAQLTGQIGGAQTLAGRQFAEQQRQFDIQQALQQQLGLGGLDVQRGQLGVEQQRLSEQARQFGLQLNEQQAARLQQGGFTTQELALESRRVENQAAQFGQQLSAQERQNQALNNLEQQKITDDRSFRAQQLGLNGRELDLRATQIQQEFAQRGQQITNDQAYRQAELALRTTQIQNENAIAGRQIGVDEARIQAQRDLSAADNAAQMNRLTAQLSSQERIATMESQLRQQLGLTEATGQVYTVGPDGRLVAGADTLESQLRRAQLTGTLGGQATLERLQQNLQQAQIMSQITGQQFTVDANGNLVRGTADTEARRQFTLENLLRQTLGMSEATGYVYDPITGQRTSQETVQGQIARSQILLSLATAFGNLTPEQIAQLLGKASPTTTGGGGTPTTPPNTADDGRLGAGQAELLQTITAPDNPREGWLYNIGGTLVRYKSGKYYKMDGSIFTPGSTPTTPPNTPTTPPNTPTTPPNTPTTPPNTPTTPPTTPTTPDPTSTTPLTDSERQVVTSSLSGALFDGRYKFEPSLGGWVVYKGNNWYRYGATPPTQNITWNGQNMNVYPGYSTYYNGEILTWDGRTWITSSTMFS